MDTVHECDRQTDRRTDGLTDRITITDTVQRIASHGKNGPIQARHSQTAMESVWPVSKLPTESVGSRRKLVANSVHTNSTVESRRQHWSAVTYWALAYASKIYTAVAMRRHDKTLRRTYYSTCFVNHLSFPTRKYCECVV